MEKHEKTVLEAFLQDADSGRFSSQDICDTLRETVTLSPDTVTEHMLDNGWSLRRQDDRLVWVK